MQWWGSRVAAKMRKHDWGMVRVLATRCPANGGRVAPIKSHELKQSAVPTCGGCVHEQPPLGAAAPQLPHKRCSAQPPAKHKDNLDHIDVRGRIYVANVPMSMSHRQPAQRPGGEGVTQGDTDSPACAPPRAQQRCVSSGPPGQPAQGAARACTTQQLSQRQRELSSRHRNAHYGGSGSDVTRLRLLEVLRVSFPRLGSALSSCRHLGLAASLDLVYFRLL